MNKEKKKFIGIITCFLAIVSLVSYSNALIGVDITVKPSFADGEKMFFDYSISSDKDETITFYPHILCPEGPIAFIEEKTIELKKEVSFSETYEDITVNDWVEPQKCTAYIKVLSPEKQKFEKTFEIITNPSMEARIITCRDPKCNNPTKVFEKGEKAYVKVIVKNKKGREIIEPTIKGEHIKPIKSIAVPFNTKTTSLTSEVTGTHEIKTTISKEGFKTKSISTQFGVMEKRIRLPVISECNPNKVCEGKENAQNCPQDCKQKTTIKMWEIKENKNLIQLFIGFLFNGFRNFKII